MIRERYVQDFGEEQARAIENAAHSHSRGTNMGSDPFKWAVAIAIGWQCVELYSKSHGITVPFQAFKDWVRAHAQLASHDGDVDLLSALGGAYDDFIVDASGPSSSSTCPACSTRRQSERIHHG